MRPELHSLTVTEIYRQKGKSYWVYYAIRRYLAEKKPVIWYRNSMLFLFAKEGVFEAPSGFRHSTLKTRVRTLVDDDHAAMTGVPSHLAALGKKYFIIFSTPPNPARWKNMNKTKQYTVCIMNPWTRKEISKRLAHPRFLCSIQADHILAPSFMDFRRMTNACMRCMIGLVPPLASASTTSVTHPPCCIIKLTVTRHSKPFRQ